MSLVLSTFGGFSTIFHPVSTFCEANELGKQKKLQDGNRTESSSKLILLMVQKSPTTTWDEKNLVNNGIIYQPQLVSRISSINSMTLESYNFEQQIHLQMHICSLSCKFSGGGGGGGGKIVRFGSTYLVGGWTTLLKKMLVKFDHFHS